MKGLGLLKSFLLYASQLSGARILHSFRFPHTPARCSLSRLVVLASYQVSGIFFPGCPSVQFSSVQSLSRVWLFVTPWTAAGQASQKFSFGGPEWLVAVTSLFTDMARNTSFLKKTSSIPRARRSCGSPKMTLMILRALSVAQQTSEKRATQGAANIMSFCPWNPRTKSLFPTWPSSECLRAKLLQSCPTLCGTVDCSPPGSSVHEILQARILEWVAKPSPRGSSTLVLLVFFPRMTKL